MDQRRFDELTKKLSLGASRRTIVKGAIGSAVTSVASLIGLRAAEAQDVSAASCLTNGARCGRKRQPGCGSCCSRCTSRQPNGQRRCSCCNIDQACNRDDQCCSGVCTDGTCVADFAS